MAAMSFSEREIAGGTCSTVKLSSRRFAAAFSSGLAHLEDYGHISHLHPAVPPLYGCPLITPARGDQSGFINILFRNIHRSRFAPAFTITAGILYGLLHGC